MIRVDFDPVKIGDAVLLRADDLKDPSGLVVRLRNAADPLSEDLWNALSAVTRQQLQQYDAAQRPPDALRDALIGELNQLLKGPPLYDRKRLRGTVWSKGRETLIKALIQQVEALSQQERRKGERFTCFNRLLMEETYPQEIGNSAKAEWDGWSLLAEVAKARVIGQWETWKQTRNDLKETQKGTPPEFAPILEDDVWKGFRDWLKSHVFHNKCAYCETKITGFPGDTEHFRPKGRVRVILQDETREIVKVLDEEGEEIQHPGYFWLAYHWQNLLPSCQFCNAAGGKLDVFPVQKAHVAVKKLKSEEINNLSYKLTQSPKAADIYYLEPADLDKVEGRLLLHPYFDNPEEHIYFQVDGIAKEWRDSEQGKVSIRVYDLNESSKKAARREEQSEARQRYMSVMAVTDDSDDLVELKKAAKKFMDEYYHGTKPYAAAVFDHMHFKLEGTRYDPAVLLGERRNRK